MKLYFNFERIAMQNLNHSSANIEIGFELDASTKNHAENEEFDYLRLARHAQLLAAIEQRTRTNRSAEQFSSAFILEQAAQRYFAMIEKAQLNLKHRFSAKQIGRIMSAAGTLIWDTQWSVATMVAGDMGIESLDEAEEGSFEHTLLEKLAALTELENMALADACERQWRGHDNPLL